jgi:hypothetical protein
LNIIYEQRDIIRFYAFAIRRPQLTWKDYNMPKNKSKIEPSKMTPADVPADSEEQGCATSFLTREKEEIDKGCGAIQPNPKEEYVQPDEEKEAGGES